MIEKLFEDVLQPYGQRWRPGRGIDQYDDQYAGMLLKFVRMSINAQKRVYGPKGPIFCDFVRSPAFNALATTAEGQELIAVFTGALSHLLAAHHCLLSDPESLPAVGDASQEKLSPDGLECFKNYIPLHEAHHHPKGERFQVATCLTWLSSVFIALHEVGHIVRCHPTYLQHKYGIRVYEELPVVNTKARDIPIALAFEWEADEYAAITSYQLTHHLLQAGNFSALRTLGLDFAWGLATSMIFLIIARLSKSWASGSRTHPPAFIRYVWSMLSVETAQECVLLNPKPELLRAGFSEAANWFKRNGIDLLSEDDKEQWSEGEAMQQLQDQYAGVKAVLAREGELLETLARDRSEKAEQWLLNEEK